MNRVDCILLNPGAKLGLALNKNCTMTHLKIPALFAAAFLAVSVSANVQASDVRLTGAVLEDACSRANPNWINFCNGYVQAIIDANRDICPPQGTTRTQIVEAVQSALQSQLALKNINAADAAHAALKSIYPCQ